MLGYRPPDCHSDHAFSFVRSLVKVTQACGSLLQRLFINGAGHQQKATKLYIQRHSNGGD